MLVSTSECKTACACTVPNRNACNALRLRASVWFPGMLCMECLSPRMFQLLLLCYSYFRFAPTINRTATVSSLLLYRCSPLIVLLCFIFLFFLLFFLCRCVPVSMCLCAYMHICTHTYVYIHIYICTHTYIDTHFRMALCANPMLPSCLVYREALAPCWYSCPSRRSEPPRLVNLAGSGFPGAGSTLLVGFIVS